jgi:nudix-type nucleoside diphosphatase (YffH/AdpP family)
MSFFAKAGVRIVENAIVYEGWSRLHRLIVDYKSSSGETERLSREVFDHGGAAAILLYDPAREVVVLVRQFRAGAHFAGRPAFMLEVPAGLLDDQNPEEAVRREALEETGYAVQDIERLFSIFPSPGSLSEEVHLFFGLVDASHRIAEGGGLDHEHEDIEVVELPLGQALAMIPSGEITDAKTIILLQWLSANSEVWTAGASGA